MTIIKKIEGITCIDELIWHATSRTNTHTSLLTMATRNRAACTICHVTLDVFCQETKLSTHGIRARRRELAHAHRVKGHGHGITTEWSAAPTEHRWPEKNSVPRWLAPMQLRISQLFSFCKAAGKKPFEPDRVGTCLTIPCSRKRLLCVRIECPKFCK
jgi:hypothetical protein